MHVVYTTRCLASEFIFYSNELPLSNDHHWVLDSVRLEGSCAPRKVTYWSVTKLSSAVCGRYRKSPYIAHFNHPEEVSHRCTEYTKKGMGVSLATCIVKAENKASWRSILRENIHERRFVITKNFPDIIVLNHLMYDIY